MISKKNLWILTIYTQFLAELSVLIRTYVEFQLMLIGIL